MSNISNIAPLVAIQCITFNHEPYIRDALEGFVMQKTNFPFVAIVHDDASTDGTAAIIREYAEKYPDIIKPIYETENQYSKKDGSLDCIMDKACKETGAKYIAICEGDDYWTDPLKLLKQVDFLESHLDCSLVCSNYDKLYQKNKTIKAHVLVKTGRVTFNDLICRNYVATNTVVYRAKALAEYRNFRSGAPNWSFEDYPMWLYAATKGYIFVFNEKMSVYRILEHSASHGLNNNAKSSWIRSRFSVFDFFDNNFEIPTDIRQKALYKLCHAYEVYAILFKDSDLINRIRSFYWNNHFYITWLSFIMMMKCFNITPIRYMIEHRQYFKTPLVCIKAKLKNRKCSFQNSLQR